MLRRQVPRPRYAERGDTPEAQIPVAIGTSRGLLVACPGATGRRVYAINPLAVARYRERHTVARSKSDPGPSAFSDSETAGLGYGVIAVSVSPG